MRSHNYDFEPRDLLRLIGLPLIPVVVFAGAMHFAAALELLPKSRPALDLDRTILIHKAEASRSRSDAEVVLIGDSSCLMDVSARQLTEHLQLPALNLGTLSYLDLTAHTALLKRFIAANPNQLKAAVILMHPEALRRPSAEAYQTKFLERLLAGEEPPPPPNTARVPQILGLEIFRSRVLARAVPAPLPGTYGQRYGFTSDLEKYLTQNRGSAVDPDPRSFQGNPEYRLAPQLENSSRAVRSTLPPGTKLLVGITPVPAGFVSRDYPELHRQMLQQWAQWLQADAALTELPATLPDKLFAKTTHLNETGAQTYTAIVAEALRRHLP